MNRPLEVSFALFSVFAVACGGSPKAEPESAAAPAAEPAPAPAAEPASAPATAAAPADAGATPSKGEQCEKHRTDAQTEMDAEIIKVDTVCKKDTDCMAVKGRACGFACVTAAIPKGEEKEWNRELAAIAEGPCKAWSDLGCAADAPAPTCRHEGKKPACQAGHCVLR